MDLLRTGLLVFILLFRCISFYAQDKAYAKKVIDTLSSPSMHGRGYVSNGDKIASDYIASQYKSFGLFSFEKSGSYFQEFVFPVNTFPGKVEMTFHFSDRASHKGLPATDFLVRSSSPSVKGHYKVVRLDSSIACHRSKWEQFTKEDHRKMFVLVDTAGVRDKRELLLLTNFVKYPVNVKGILLPVKMNHVEGTHDCSKLTAWDFSMVQSTVPVIEVDPSLASVTEIDVRIGAKFIKEYTSRNVCGYVRGSVKPDSFIVFTAHYDHLGRLGKDVYFPGANDNASGVAMLLNLAKYYSDPAHQPEYSIAFLAFGAEEVGLIGSMWYTSHPVFPMSQIRFLINMDILGTGDEGITVVNATLFPSEFKKIQEINSQNQYLPQIKSRGKASISDHHFFTEKNVPCFYFYTLGGIKAYHDVCDRRETLPLTEFDDIFRLIRDFTQWLMNPAKPSGQ